VRRIVWGRAVARSYQDPVLALREMARVCKSADSGARACMPKP